MASNRPLFTHGDQYFDSQDIKEITYYFFDVKGNIKEGLQKSWTLFKGLDKDGGVMEKGHLSKETLISIKNIFCLKIKLTADNSYLHQLLEEIINNTNLLKFKAYKYVLELIYHRYSIESLKLKEKADELIRWWIVSLRLDEITNEETLSAKSLQQVINILKKQAEVSYYFYVLSTSFRNYTQKIAYEKCLESYLDKAKDAYADYVEMPPVDENSFLILLDKTLDEIKCEQAKIKLSTALDSLEKLGNDTHVYNQAAVQQFHQYACTLYEKISAPDIQDSKKFEVFENTLEHATAAIRDASPEVKFSGFRMPQLANSPTALDYLIEDIQKIQNILSKNPPSPSREGPPSANKIDPWKPFLGVLLIIVGGLFLAAGILGIPFTAGASAIVGSKIAAYCFSAAAIILGIGIGTAGSMFLYKLYKNNNTIKPIEQKLSSPPSPENGVSELVESIQKARKPL